MALFIISLGLFCIPLLTLGLAGRLAALGLLVVAAANILAAGLHFDNGLMLASTIYVMLFGTGALSLWQPEDRFINRRA
jgi:hypothetical protein